MFAAITVEEIATCTLNSWTPTIGDPTVWGWLTVVVYGLCAILAIFVAIRMRPGRRQLFWILVAVLMAFLAVNKELDLQSALTAAGRCLARMQGWYDERHIVQRRFIFLLLVTTTIAVSVGLYQMRRHFRTHGMAILGLATVALFVAVRAIGFHDVDQMINDSVADIRFNFLFEVSGLILIASNAVYLLVVYARRRK